MGDGETGIKSKGLFVLLDSLCISLKICKCVAPTVIGAGKFGVIFDGGENRIAA